MSTDCKTAVEIAQRETELLDNPGRVRVSVNVSWQDGLCLPDDESDDEEEAVFNVMTFGDHLVFDKACRYYEDIDGHKVSSVDYNEMRRLSLRRNLADWTLDVPIERHNGWLTDECYERVSGIPAPLIEAFLDGFWKSSEIDSEEEKTINKQAGILFRKNSGGVSNACETVRMFCTMSSFAEKFNMSHEDIRALPFRDYVRLKMMVDHENESMKKEQGSDKKKSETKVAGRDGKARPSKGEKIPM